ncbi:MAG: metallophosphoesterase [Hyphomicrobiaceae bacterium]
MRLQVISDFHFDVMPCQEPRLAPGVDAVVVAGDVCEGIARGMAWLRRHLGERVPIIMVAGNHEHFGRVRPAEIIAGHEAARRLGITFLDDGEAVIGGVRFLGATLWADFDLFGCEVRAEAMSVAQSFMVDHRQVLEADGRRFLPAEARSQHLASRGFLDLRLARSHAGPSVVVTHHAPHRRSLAERWRDDVLSAAFVSDLSALIERHQPALWVHGHTHTSFDYRIGASRIVCNPHGYGDENEAFDPGLVLDV